MLPSINPINVQIGLKYPLLNLPKSNKLVQYTNDIPKLFLCILIYIYIVDNAP